MPYVDTTWYCNFGDGSTTGYYAISQWSTGTKTAGTVVRQNTTPAVGNERVFICVIGGSAGASEPTWTLTRGAKTTDSGVTWMEATGQPALCGDATNTTPWASVKTASLSLGQIVKDSAGTHAFICTTAGTTGSTEPLWNTSAVGNTTTDSGATWTYVGLLSGFSAWGAPHARVANVNGVNWAAAGDTIYIGDNHAETQASAIAAGFPGTPAAPNALLCIDHTASLPPSAANLKTSATVSTTGSSNITLSGSFYCYGVTFSVGGGGSNIATLALGGGGAAQFQRYDSCGLKIAATYAGSTISIGVAALPAETQVELNGATITFGATGQVINQYAMLYMRGGSLGGSTFPSNFLAPSYMGLAWIEGMDLSSISSGSNLVEASFPSGTTIFKNCKLASGVGIVGTTVGSGQVILDGCDSGTGTYRNELYDYGATQTTETTIVRTGGASDGVTTISWKIVTTANATWPFPFEANAIAIWNSTTGANRAVTVEGIWNAAAVPNNDDIWMDIEYLGTSGNPLGAWYFGSKSSPISASSALTASAQAWDGQASARANSTGYIAGNVIKLASNPGRLFFCTTAGTSASSEPGGYSSAVDGGSVNDGTAVFRAGVRFKLTATLSSPQPQNAGLISAYVRAAKASATFWIDPLITLG